MALALRRKVNNKDHCETGVICYYVDGLTDDQTVEWSLEAVTDGQSAPPFEVSGVGNRKVEIDVSGVDSEQAFSITAVACTPEEDQA